MAFFCEGKRNKEKTNVKRGSEGRRQ
jgi:hypothetical protein